MGKLVHLKYFVFFPIIGLFFTQKGIFQEKKLSEQVLQHEVTVTLKLVHVYVTDKKGNRVVDLNPEDFVVYDNGKRQRVTDFERHIHSLILEKLEKKEEIAATQVPEARQLMSRKFFL